MTLANFARDLLNQLVAARLEAGDEGPSLRAQLLIFVAHGLGGVVVKKVTYCHSGGTAIPLASPGR